MKPGNNLVVVDVETTGPNPFEHDVLAVALVPVMRPELAMLVYIRYEALQWTDFGSQNFDKFKNDWLQSAISPVRAVHEINLHLDQVVPTGEVILVGHNVGFDLTFLRKLAFLSKRPIPRISHRSIDTHSLLYLAALHHGWEASLSSDAAFEALQISPPSYLRHTALGDAMATRLLFLRLVDILDPADHHELKRSLG